MRRTLQALVSVGLLSLGACSGADPTGSPSIADDGESVGEAQQALQVVPLGTRRTVWDITPEERATLASAILDFITQPVLQEHADAHDWHHPGVGEYFFIRHHDYLNQLEAYLTSVGLTQLVPLPVWDPGTPIPDEFMVWDELVNGNGSLEQFPDRPMPNEFYDVCSFSSASDLARQLENFHDGVHGAVGGPMGSIDTAPGAPIFWLWHGFLDDVYHAYEGLCENRKDFDRDVHTDVLWHNPDTGNLSIWLLDGMTVRSEVNLNAQLDSSSGWSVRGTGDFNFDGRTDVLWHHENGNVAAWFLDGTNVLDSAVFPWSGSPHAGWEIKGTGDFNRDGYIDVLWHNGVTGQVHLWYLEGITIIGTADLNWNVPGSSGWQLKGTGDFNADGHMDLVWHHPESGTVGLWLMDGTTVVENPTIGWPTPGSSGWQLEGTGDYDRDGNIDLLWHHPSSGTVGSWLMNGTTVVATPGFSQTKLGTEGKIVSR